VNRSETDSLEVTKAWQNAGGGGASLEFPPVRCGTPHLRQSAASWGANSTNGNGFVAHA